MSKESGYNEKELKTTIDNILYLLKDTCRALGNSKVRSSSAKLNAKECYEFMETLNKLFEEYSSINPRIAGTVIINNFIRLINFFIAMDTNQDRLIGYHNMLENAYRLAGRVSLEHFIIYYEWYEKDKLYETRYEILQPYVYYLNKMCWDRNFVGMIVNLPSGYGKSRLVRLYEAFRLGIDPKGTFLALCSNDDLIKGQSRSVIDIIKNPRYGDVFSNLKWSEKDRNFFLKETDGEWKLKECSMIATYYAKSTRSNVVGLRASLSIDIDDLYADYKEALDENLNKEYFNKFLTVWRKRYVQHLEPQVIVTGTMWSATDFLTKLIDLWEKESEFVKHPKLKFTRISKDNKRVIIQVPALDYETGESTCPKLKSTEELLKERDSMEKYLWETNFQQNPTSPEGLYFDWGRLETYTELPQANIGRVIASLDPSRKGKDFTAMPILIENMGKFYLKDCLYSQLSMSELHDKIVDKVISNHITQLVVETNTDTSLPSIIEKKLQERGYYACTIYEKYNYENKEQRINNMKDPILKSIVFPAKFMYGKNTDMGKALEGFTSYSFEYPNRHDDFPDSMAMVTNELILGNAIPQRATAIIRRF